VGLDALWQHGHHHTLVKKILTRQQGSADVGVPRKANRRDEHLALSKTGTYPYGLFVGVQEYSEHSREGT
jgi:hypothetical protein